MRNPRHILSPWSTLSCADTNPSRSNALLQSIQKGVHSDLRPVSYSRNLGYSNRLHQIVGRHRLVPGAQKYRTRSAVSHEQLVELCLRVVLGAEFRRFWGRSIFP